MQTVLCAIKRSLLTMQARGTAIKPTAPGELAKVAIEPLAGAVVEQLFACIG
jgi:hypothetical protein